MPLISVTTLATNGRNKMYSMALIQVSNCNLHDEFVTALPSYYSLAISRSYFLKKKKTGAERHRKHWYTHKNANQTNISC